MALKSLYKIISRTNRPMFSVHIQLDSKHDIYLGHFPNAPITPGVVMLQILKDLVEQKLSKQLLMTRASNVKFLTPVDPTINKDLLYSIKIIRNSHSFTIKNTTTFTDGTPVLKCNATFVVR